MSERVTRYCVKDYELAEIPAGGILAPTDNYSEVVEARHYDALAAKLAAIESARCAMCGHTTFVGVPNDHPLAIDRQTSQGVFRMACEHCLTKAKLAEVEQERNRFLQALEAIL